MCTVRHASHTTTENSLITHGHACIHFSVRQVTQPNQQQVLNKSDTEMNVVTQGCRVAAWLVDHWRGAAGDLLLATALSMAADWCFHSLGHVRHPLNPAYHVHMRHHRRYGGKHLLRPRPYLADYGALAFGPLILLFWRMLWCACAPASGFRIIFCSALFGAASDSLHSQFHVRGSPLERSGWFLRLRAYHFAHHHHPRKNMSLGGLSAPMDWLMGTLRAADEDQMKTK